MGGTRVIKSYILVSFRLGKRHIIFGFSISQADDSLFPVCYANFLVFTGRLAEENEKNTPAAYFFVLVRLFRRMRRTVVRF